MSRSRALGRTGIARLVSGCLLAALVLGGCAGCSGASSKADAGKPTVLADTSFLADIVQNVAGDRFAVASIIPTGADPHSFEPTPRDATRIAKSKAVFINSRGLEPEIDDLVSGAGGSGPVVREAAAGLASGSADPHYWMDPVAVITYVENIRKGLTGIDPEGADAFTRNAQAYSEKLRSLDTWIAGQVYTIPAARRLLVTNHESLGHFADRYGFTIVGAIFNSVSGEGALSAKDLASLAQAIKATGTPAIFLEAGNNSDVAKQLAQEDGVRVVTDLYIHSLGKEAPTYLDMMRWDVKLIVEALR